jgi:hypothetical protein
MENVQYETVTVSAEHRTSRTFWVAQADGCTIRFSWVEWIKIKLGIVRRYPLEPWSLRNGTLGYLVGMGLITSRTGWHP